MIKGRLRVPGDKSISHRAVMFGAISKGITNIKGFLTGADCISTIIMTDISTKKCLETQEATL